MENRLTFYWAGRFREEAGSLRLSPSLPALQGGKLNNNERECPPLKLLHTAGGFFPTRDAIVAGPCVILLPFRFHFYNYGGGGAVVRLKFPFRISVRRPTPRFA